MRCINCILITSTAYCEIKVVVSVKNGPVPHNNGELKEIKIVEEPKKINYTTKKKKK